MTQELFFGTIYGNLQYLASEPMLLRALGYDSAVVKELRKTVRKTPDNIRAYEVKFDGSQKVRIFLGFANGNTEKDYKDVKHHLRRWYQLNGYAFAEEGVVNGVVIIGTASSWDAGVNSTMLDLPSCVKGHLLYSPSAESIHFGDCVQVGVVNSVLKKLLLPIRYQDRVERIRAFSQMVISSGPFGFMGYPTLKRVSEKLGAEFDEIGRVWVKMEAEGLLVIRELRAESGACVERLYIKRGCSSWLRRMWRKLQVNSGTFCLNIE